MPYRNKLEFRNGKIVLYTRGKKANFHARLKVTGTTGYIVKTTGYSTEFEARRIAEEWLDDYELSARKGQQILSKTPTFETVFGKWLEAHQHTISKHRLTYIRNTAKRYFITYFAEKPLAQISDSLIAGYWSWRINYWNSSMGQEQITRARNSRWTPAKPKRNTLGMVSKAPTQSTVSHEQAALRQVFKWAKLLGYVSNIPIIEAPKLGRKSVRRADFNLDEWTQLVEYLDHWVQPLDDDGLNGFIRFQRKLLRNYIIFMAGSGFRPNEARQLRWRDITWTKDEYGNSHCEVHVNPATKTGPRVAILTKQAEMVLFEMLDTYLKDENDGEEEVGGFNLLEGRKAPPGKIYLNREYVFGDRHDRPVANFGKTFKTVLRDAGLLKDRFGVDRTIYSLRHTHVTFRLLYGETKIPVQDLAANIGTSVRLITSTYSHVTTRQRAHILGGSLTPDEKPLAQL